MRKATILFMMGLLGLVVPEGVTAQDVGLKWFRDFGSARDSEYGLGIHTDEAGFVYTTGYVGDMVDFNRQGTTPVVSGYPSNSGDAFITKHRPDGDLVWVRNMVGASSEKGNDVTTDRDGNVYVTGSFRGTTNFNPGGIPAVSFTAVGGSDMFVTKYNSNGVFQWVKVFGNDGEDEGSDIITDSAGNVYITGYFANEVSFGNITLNTPGVLYALVAKLDTHGDVIWAHGFGVGGPRGTQHSGNAITLDEQENVYVIGDFTETVDFNPAPTVTDNLTSAGGTDVFILKLTKNGDYVWARSMEGPTSGTGLDIRADGLGNLYAVGWFTDSMNVNPSGTRTMLRTNALGAGWNGFLAKYDVNGIYSWGFPIGGTQSTQALGVATDQSGNVYVTGYYDGTVDFNPDPVNTAFQVSVKSWDIFVARYSPAGDFVWVKTAGGEGDPGAPSASDVGQSVAVDTGYNVYVTGFYQGTVDFDPGPDTADFTTAGRTDVFIWKLRCPMTESATVISELCSSSYEWNGVEYTESGTYTHDFYLGEGCDSVATLDLTLGEAIERPMIGVDEYTLSVRSGYASYQWLFNDTVINGATDSILTVNKNGNYAVVVSNSYNCTDTSAVYMVNNVSVAGVQVYGTAKVIPNPARTRVYITGVHPRQVVVATLDGRQVIASTDNAELYIGDLPGGIYIISVYGDEGAVLLREKLMKLD